MDLRRDRQAPAPAARCWLLDLNDIRGPRFVVFRLDLLEAKAALASHFVETGIVATPDEADELVAEAVEAYVGVIW